jgi:predicted amidohydrolase
MAASSSPASPPSGADTSATLRVALVQMTVTDGAPETNLARATALVTAAPAADVYLLPELFTTGYAHAAWEGAARGAARTLDALQQLADARQAWIAGSFVARTSDGGLANRLHLLAPRGVAPSATLVTYDKAHLFPAMGEPGRLVAGTARVRTPIGRGDAAATAALSICFDLRFPEQYRRDAVDGATLFLCVAEWPHPRGETLRLLARARAAENQGWLALCNRVGPAADGTTFAGGSCLVAPDGAVVADAGDAMDAVVVADVDADVALRARATFPVLPLRVPGVDG